MNLYWSHAIALQKLSNERSSDEVNNQNLIYKNIYIYIYKAETMDTLQSF